MSIFLASFLFATASHSCPAHGVPLFEMRDESELANKPTITTKIFDSGAWTIETDGHVESGCFDRTELRAIRRAVQHASWKVTTSPIRCFARSTSFTEYFEHGKLRFTESLCSGKTMDTGTLAAISLVKQDLADAR
jgi:hypothetical protein